MSEVAANVIVTSPSGRQLRASFVRQYARFVGSVWLEDAEHAQELLRETLADEQPWPVSPPWQELHMHDEGGARALLLVGRAGSSHWSMAVSPDAERRAIVFDVACRVRTQPEFLGSTFLCVAPMPSEITLQPHAVDQRPAPEIEQTSQSIIVRPQFEIAPPATIRWKFSIAIAE